MWDYWQAPYQMTEGIDWLLVLKHYWSCWTKSPSVSLRHSSSSSSVCCECFAFYFEAFFDCARGIFEGPRKDVGTVVHGLESFYLIFYFVFYCSAVNPEPLVKHFQWKVDFFGFCSTFLHMEAFDQMFVASSHWLVTSLDIFKPLPKIQSGLFVLDVPQWCESFSSFDWKTTTNYNSRTGEKALTSFFFSARWEKYQVGCDPITCTHWQEVSSRVWGWSTLIDTTFCLNLVPLGWVLGLQCPIFKLLFLILHLIPVNV